MIRKIVIALILVPLTVVLIAFAVANRQNIIVSLDPLDRTDPTLSFSMPLFALILAFLIGGVIVGGIATWLRQGRWRWRARLAERQVRELYAENEHLRQQVGIAPATHAGLAKDASRLTIPPPAG